MTLIKELLDWIDGEILKYQKILDDGFFPEELNQNQRRVYILQDVKTKLLELAKKDLEEFDTYVGSAKIMVMGTMMKNDLEEVIKTEVK